MSKHSVVMRLLRKDTPFFVKNSVGDSCKLSTHELSDRTVAAHMTEGSKGG